MQNPSPATPVQIGRFTTAAGARIFQIPIQMFPILNGSVYLVLIDDPERGRFRVLIDAGSGMLESNQNLEAGLEAAAELAGEDLSWANLTHILITHGHIDHFGGLSYIRSRTEAKIGVHELDLRNLTNYEERLVVVSRRLDEFLVEAGVSPAARQQMTGMYMITKGLYHSVRVDFTYEAVGNRLGPFEFFHVPGHCAGHVVIRLDEILFSGDHILEHTSPHQSPEHLTLSTGLDHYLKSLDSLQSWSKGIQIVLGGHEKPIYDLANRIEEIREVHAGRLRQVLDLLEEPRTILDVSQALFGEVHGYNVLLALEEAGAHVEYLYQRGELGIDNLEEMTGSSGPVPIRYRRLEREAFKPGNDD